MKKLLVSSLVLAVALSSFGQSMNRGKDRVNRRQDRINRGQGRLEECKDANYPSICAAKLLNRKLNRLLNKMNSSDSQEGGESTTRFLSITAFDHLNCQDTEYNSALHVIDKDLSSFDAIKRQYMNICSATSWHKYTDSFKINDKCYNISSPGSSTNRRNDPDAYRTNPSAIKTKCQQLAAKVLRDLLTSARAYASIE